MRYLIAFVMTAALLMPSEIVQEDALPGASHHPSGAITLNHLKGAVYRVQGDELTERLSGIPHFYHDIMWKNEKLLVDAFGVGDRIPEFQVFIQQSNTLAYVRQLSSNRQGSRWRLAVNAGYDQDLAAAFRANVHELTHVLVDAGRVDDVGCPVEIGNRAEADRLTYLVPFVWQFWHGCVGPEPQRQAYRPDDFVTRYAATSIEEDMAESAAAYFICGRENSLRGEAKKKVAFFDQVPQTRAIYERIHKEFGSLFFKSVHEYMPELCGTPVATPH